MTQRRWVQRAAGIGSRRELFGVRHLANEAVCLNGDQLRTSIVRLLSRCDALHGHLANNGTALIDHGSRHRAGLPDRVRDITRLLQAFPPAERRAAKGLAHS